MPRYLLYFSYLGTRFSGLQKQPRNITVQGVLEYALSTVLRVPDNFVRVFISSRTDAGVHALMNTATITLPPPGIPPDAKLKPVLGVNPDPPYDPNYLQAALNHLMWDLDLEVRIIGCRVVSDGFCPRRHASMRSYLYRLAVLKPEYDLATEPALLQNAAAIAPLIELDRSWPIDSNFNMCAFRETAELLQGTHNFASFMSNPFAGKMLARKDERIPLATQRFIRHIDIESGTPLMDPKYEPLSGCFNYYDINIYSKSFLYNQIRRMVSAMVSVAQSKISLKDVKWLLQNPHFESWNRFRLNMAPASGLYLQRIEYNANDFDNPNPDYSRKVDATGSEEEEEEISDEESEMGPQKEEKERTQSPSPNRKKSLTN